MRIIMAMLMLVLLAGCGPDTPTVDDAIGGPVFELDGEQISFDDFRGQWVIVNYWATWCVPCITEIPELNAFYAANQTHAVVFGVNFEGLDNPGLRTAAQHFDIQYPLLTHDPTAKFGVGDIVVLPTTIIIDPEGRVVDKIAGEQTQVGLEKIIAG